MPKLPRYKKQIKRKRTAAKPASTAAKATKALALVRQIQRKVEYKHIDYNISANGIDTTGSDVYPLMQDLSKEVNANTRIGDEVSPARLHLTGSIWLNSTTPQNTSTVYRLVLIKGVRENNAIPVMGAASSAALGVFDNTNSAALIYARKYLPNIRDSVIIYDKLFTIDPSSSTRRMFKWNFKLSGKTRYVAGGANTTEDGGYFLLCCTDNNSLAANISFNSRITFSDD